MEYITADDFVLKNTRDGGKILVKSKIRSGEIIIPDELGITEIGKRAFGASMFSYYKITKIKSNTVKIIRENAFRGCHDLNWVSFPMVEAIGEDAFRSCGNLESVSFPMVKTIGEGAFKNCLVLSNFLSNSNVRYIGSNAFTRVTSSGIGPDSHYQYHPLSFDLEEQLGFKAIKKGNTFRYEKLALDSDISNEKTPLETQKKNSSDEIKKHVTSSENSDQSTIIIVVLAIVGACCIGIIFLFIIGLSIS